MSKQLRIRITDEAGKVYLDLPPLARGRAVSMILLWAARRINLVALLHLRGELVRLGTLLNQSLRTSWGRSCDGEAARKIVKILERNLK
jgi:hypothetical protein